MKIMVGYDGSEAAKDALELAKKHAKAFDAEIHLVASMAKGTDTKLAGIEKIEAALQYAQDSVEEENIPCQQHLLIRGLTAGEDLVEYVRENGIDTVFAKLFKIQARFVEKLMAAVFEVVLINRVVYDPLHVAFIVAHHHFQFIDLGH